MTPFGDLFGTKRRLSFRLWSNLRLSNDSWVFLELFKQLLALEAGPGDPGGRVSEVLHFFIIG